MLKRILIPVLLIASLISCSDDKAKEKALLDSVVSEHDKVMGYESVMMQKKSTLKALAAGKPELKDSVAYFSKLLDNNDNAMMNWMNKFNPDFTGKSHSQVMDYLTRQKKLVMGIDSNFKNAIHLTSAFITKGGGK